MHLILLALKIPRKPISPQYTDEQVVTEVVRCQNPVMVEILYQRYADKVYQKCLSFVKDNDTAQDLTHDIFIKVYLNLGSFQGRSKFSTWLYSITYNFCIEYLRKQQKEKTVQMETDDDTENNIADTEIESVEEFEYMQADRLAVVLDKAKVEDKMILLMKYKEDMSIKEIQDTLKISESAVKMRIKRAKEKINELYKKMYHA